MSKMFETFLASIPKSRSEMVNELELPADLTAGTYTWSPVDESFIADSLDSVSLGDYEVNTRSSDSSLALSRAMTDSEIDYGRYRRYKSRNLSDPWLQLKAVLDSLPPDYLASVNSFRSSPELIEDTGSVQDIVRTERLRHVEELRLKMERFFAEECRVFTDDDPAVLVLEDALQHADMNDSKSDISAS